MSHLIKVSLAAMLFLVAFVYAQPSINEHNIKFENTTTATLVGEDGVIMRTTNNGVSWFEQTSGITNVLYGNESTDGIQPSETISIAVGENGVILKTNDGGSTWVVINSGVIEHLYDVEALSSSNIIVCGGNGTILQSVDAGETWNIVQNQATENLNDICFLDLNTGFIVGDNGTTLKTVDAGQTWQMMPFPVNNGNLNSVAFATASDIIIVGNVNVDIGILYKSNDGGLSWSAYEEQFTYGTSLNEIVFFNSTNGIIVGSNGFILKTNNAGFTWSQGQSSSLTTDLFSVAFSDINHGISVGSNGTELYTTDGGATWRETISASPYGSKTLPLALKQNYPNPFNPSTVISFELPKDASVTLKVYDIAGKEVANLLNGYLTTGNHSVNFNASGLASGVYFYKLNVVSGEENTSKVMKMLLVK